MNFLNEVKNEASKVIIKESRLILAELAGYIRICCQVRLRQKQRILDFYTDNASVARRIFTYLKTYTPHVKTYSKKIDKVNIYHLEIEDEYSQRDLLYDTGFLKDGNFLNLTYSTKGSMLTGPDEIKAYVRALFLGAGYIFDPEKTYHLEIQTNKAQLSEDLIYRLGHIGIEARVSERKKGSFVYIKDADIISDFLTIIGAKQAMFKFENYRTIKDIRNNINRLVNFETANINKTVAASLRQVEDINYLQEKGMMADLNDDLKEVANLRIQNPDASLSEIAKLSGKYSKAAINYRLNRISKYANKLRGV